MNLTERICELAGTEVPRLPQGEAVAMMTMERASREVLGDAKASCLEQLVALAVLNHVTTVVDREDDGRAGLRAARAAFKTETARASTVLASVSAPLYAAALEWTANLYEQSASLEQL